MKKIITSLLSLCLLISFQTYCYANTVHTSDNITIIYQENSVWTEEQKEQFLMLISSDQLEYTPYSLLCLFGHNEVIEYHNVIKHKALSVAPRCADQIYKVVTCTRCDYMDATVIYTEFLFCCPED